MIVRFTFRLFILILVPALVAYGTYSFMRHAFFLAMDPSATEKVVIEVAPKSSMQEVANRLAQSKLIHYPWSITFLARFKQSDRTIKAGEYELTAAMTPQEILKKLVSGEMFRRRVSIPEGSTLVDIAKLYEKAGLLSAQAFLAGIDNLEWLKAAAIRGTSFEGYLFPETYDFSRPFDLKPAIWRMMEEGEKHWLPEYWKRMDELGMTRHQIATLASIIQKESYEPEDQLLVSSVFHNRLQLGMKLQSDPTVIYGIPNFDGNLTRENLFQAHPYNTYVNTGLPPGPICNPGDTAIKAALYPAKSTYLFFVGDGNGKHVFATTLQEHNENVVRYQKNRRPEAKEAEPTPVVLPEVLEETPPPLPPSLTPAAPAPATVKRK